MSRVHALRFEALESRELLSTAHRSAHAARAHARPAVVGAPLVLDGTLTVHNKAATTGEDMASGYYTTSAPVSGQLSGLGAVHGVWYESTDSQGDYLGPDTITLRNAKGGFTVAFNNGTPGPAHATANKTVYYEHAQHVISSSGAYAGSAESGSLDLNMNAAHTAVESITLSSSGG